MREARTSTGFRVRYIKSSQIGPVGGFNDHSGSRRITYGIEYGGQTAKDKDTTDKEITSSGKKHKETNTDGSYPSIDNGNQGSSNNNGNNDSSSNNGNKDPPQNKELFACRELSVGNAYMGEATVTDSFGSANDYLNRITVKLFNTSVVPGRILHGVVYMKVKKPMQIFSILVKDNGSMTKQVQTKEPFRNNVNSDEFSTEIVASSGNSDTRDPQEYKALTNNFEGKDVYKRLKLTEDLHEGDIHLKSFRGPIKLLTGTHAIPFAIRIPAATKPSLTFSRSNGKLGKVVIQNTHNLLVSMDVEPAIGGENTTVFSGNVPFRVSSCGGLPPNENGKYRPGISQKIDLPYKDSSAIVILEKMHLLTTDTLRIYVFTNKEDAVHTVFAEFLQSVNIPEIELSDLDDVYRGEMSESLRMLYRTKKKKMEVKFSKTFISKVGEKFPSSSGEHSNLYEEDAHYDEIIMPVSSRKSGCMLEIPIKNEGEPSIEIDETRIRYHVRIHFDVKASRKNVSMAKLITLHERLLHDYKIENIVFTDVN